MIITDHINLIGANPLSGPNEDRWGPRFVDQTEVYDLQLRERSRKPANIAASTCVKAFMPPMAGPTYETPAEIRFLRTIGADAVGMSTVPEAIVARHMGMKVAGFRCWLMWPPGISGNRSIMRKCSTRRRR